MPPAFLTTSEKDFAMAAKSLPPQELLNKLLRYDSETGHLYWLPRNPHTFPSRHAPSGRNTAHCCNIFNSKFAHKRAFTCPNRGGYSGQILGVPYLAHRIIWKLLHGDEPTAIDHINGDPLDNRLVNLRAADAGINARNRRVRHDNTSGVTGVTLHKRDKKWYAAICYDGTTKHLGVFDQFHDAQAARKAAEPQYGFHPNHGRAANPQPLITT